MLIVVVVLLLIMLLPEAFEFFAGGIFKVVGYLAFFFGLMLIFVLACVVAQPVWHALTVFLGPRATEDYLNPALGFGTMGALWFALFESTNGWPTITRVYRFLQSRSRTVAVPQPVPAVGKVSPARESSAEVRNRQIIAMAGQGNSPMELARHFGVRYERVHQILTREEGRIHRDRGAQ